ncbi:MAG: hypothetical protein AAF726_04845 [Planctomycetota bacterium]
MIPATARAIRGMESVAPYAPELARSRFGQACVRMPVDASHEDLEARHEDGDRRRGRDGTA